MKACCKCKQSKGLTEFNRRHRDGYQSQCKSCQKEYRDSNKNEIKKWRKMNADKLREQQREYQKANKYRRKKYDQRYYLKLNLANSKISHRTLCAWAAQVKALTPLCNLCLSRENLHAHHIIHKSDRPDLALDVNNGLTLCKNCHVKIHKLEASCSLLGI